MYGTGDIGRKFLDNAQFAASVKVPIPSSSQIIHSMGNCFRVSLLPDAAALPLI